MEAPLPTGSVQRHAIAHQGDIAQHRGRMAEYRRTGERHAVEPAIFHDVGELDAIDIAVLMPSTDQNDVSVAQHERHAVVERAWQPSRSMRRCAYGIQRSLWGKMKAMMKRMPALFRGMGMTGMAGMRTGNLLPADFLIDANGSLADTYCGQDSGDHIPMERVELFAARGLAAIDSAESPLRRPA